MEELISISILHSAVALLGGWAHCVGAIDDYDVATKSHDHVEECLSIQCLQIGESPLGPLGSLPRLNLEV